MTTIFETETFNECIIKAQKGDIASQRILYEEAKKIIRPLMYNFKESFKRNGLDEDDFSMLFNEAIIDVLSSKDITYTNFRSYFYGKYKYLLLNELRKSSMRTKNETSVNFDDYEVQSKLTYDEEIKDHINDFEVQKMIKNIGQTNKPIANLICEYFYKGYTSEQIAKQTGLSYYKVEKIRELLAEEISKSFFRFPYKKKLPAANYFNNQYRDF